MSVPVLGACSGGVVLADPAGYFDSDGDVEVPSPPPGNLDNIVPSGNNAGTKAYGVTTCTWLFEAIGTDPQQVNNNDEFDTTLKNVYVTFSLLALSPGDTLILYDGKDSSAPKLATYTSASQVSGVPVGTSTRDNATMYVEFISTAGSTTNGHGFAGYWQAGACLYGLVPVTSTTGYFTDGSGPNMTYASRLTCGWLIQSSTPNAIITLSVSPYSVEDGYDFIYVYDGSTILQPLIGRVTGYETGDNSARQFISTANSMLVIFQSDKTVCYDGFQATYTITTTGQCMESTVLDATAGRVGDGSSLANYLPNQDCFWVITQTDVFVAIYFETFALASGDYLEITDGIRTTPIATLQGGTIPTPVIYDGSGNLTLHFHTDAQSEAQGFTFIFNAGACLGAVALTQPNFDVNDGSGSETDSYANNQDCYWMITLDSDLYESIVIDFLQFDVEYRFDILTIYDGLDTATSPILVQYSGYNQSFPETKTTGPSMIVRWTTDADTSARGWTISYQGQLIPPPGFVAAYYDTAPAIVFLVLLMCTATVIVFLFVFIAGFGFNQKVVMHTSYSWNLFLIMMLFFCCFGLYPYLGEPTDGLCAWRPWTSLLFVTTFMTIVIKMYTVWYFLIRMPKEEKGGLLSINYSWKVLLIDLAVLILFVAIELIYLILWTAIDHPKPVLHDTNNSDEQYLRCESDNHAIWISIQFGYIGVLLVLGLIAAIRVYVVRVLWNEGKLLALTTVLVIIVTIVCTAVLYVVWDIPLAWISIMGFCLWLQISIILCLLFIPKVYRIVRSWFRKSSAAIDDDWNTKDSKKDVDDSGLPSPKPNLNKDAM